jgi:FKBP-type peptidyl-prolyl cis-trans isomerase FkpA
MRISLVILVATLGLAACGDDNPNSPTPPFAPFSATDLAVGTGAEAVNGRNVTVGYALWLYDPAGTDGKGRQIPQQPGVYSFVLGTGNAIQGWHRGIPGMRVGGRRRLVIPPDLAYGSQGAGGGQIPPNSTLVFDVELQAVQ